MIDPIAGSILPVTAAHKSISSTQIPMRRDASAAVSVTSSIGFVVLGGAFNILDSVGMIASRPKLKFPLPRLTYHIGPLASNRCVEAEPRTTAQGHTARQWLFPEPAVGLLRLPAKAADFSSSQARAQDWLRIPVVREVSAPVETSTRRVLPL